ncbi:MAG: hypothetical protein KDJ37_12615 [Hyphomicrobiaceae bacterium]|nr:hypothetical protein [Hyphomicrobiaceae bacterium]
MTDITKSTAVRSGIRYGADGLADGEGGVLVMGSVAAAADMASKALADDLAPFALSVLAQ